MASAILLLLNAKISDMTKVEKGDELFSLQNRRLSGFEDHEGNLISLRVRTRYSTEIDC